MNLPPSTEPWDELGITTTDVAGDNIEGCLDCVITVSDVAAMRSIKWSVDDATVEVTATYTFELLFTNDLPTGASLGIELPVEIGIPTVTGCSSLTVSGSASPYNNATPCTVSTTAGSTTNVMIFKQLWAEADEIGLMVVSLSGFTNPTVTTGHTATVYTMDSTGTYKFDESTVDLVFEPRYLKVYSMEPYSEYGINEYPDYYTISVLTSGPVETDYMFLITLPSDFFEQTDSTCTASGLDGDMDCSIDTST